MDGSQIPTLSRKQSVDGQEEDMSTRERQGSRLLSKLKALTASSSLQGHGRSSSGWTINGEFTSDGQSPSHVMSPSSEREEPQYEEEEADADAEESGVEYANGRSSQRPKKRKRIPRQRVDGPSTAPTTPRGVLKMPSFQREASEGVPNSAPSNRPTFMIRRATMSDIPEHQRAGVSEDEGRDRLAGVGMWRRGSAWVQGHRGLSHIGVTRQRSGDPSSDRERPRALRLLTAFAGHDLDTSPTNTRHRSERGSGVGAQKWRQLKAGLKLLAQRRKEENRIDHAKSAELMAELLAGAPAALFLASMFQRDNEGRKRIPVLLEQLKVKVTDSQRVESKSGDRHVLFRIELEYGSSLARMKWVISRSLKDFAELHIKYKLQSQGERYKQLGRIHEGKSKLPHFPKSAFPYLRGVRGLFDDEADEEEEEHTAGEQSGVEGEASGPERLPRPKRRRSSLGFGRKTSSIPGSSVGGVIGGLGGRSGSIAGPMSSALRKETYAERQRRKLEEYLTKLITYVIFRPDSNRLCRFLEISALGVRLAAEGGYHGKEGYLSIYGLSGLDYRRTWKPNLIKNRHEAKWFLVRHSYIVCVDSPDEMHIYDVFLVDPDFKIRRKSDRRIRDEKPQELARRAKESAANPSHHKLRLINSEREMKMFAKSERLLHQFEESINFMTSQTIWAKPQRYNSFAPVRENVYAQFLVDGRDYMWNVSRAISMARDVIYIHDWWLSPELYMRRPAAISQRWRLDRLLKRKADEGVKIFVIVYRNINSAIPIDSEYSKFSLLDLGENVYVQRSPNQFRQNTFFWAHHEKICVIDHCVAFCGGVDLCFGRWDTPAHPLTDDKLTGFEVNNLPKDSDHCQLWPGKDYSNPRVQDFYSLDKPYEEMYDRTKIPRMPWHDIGMQIVGQPARDLSRHFVQRWNYILRQRQPSRPTPMILPPPDFLPADIEALGLGGTCEVQICRSACAWSLGTSKVEHSIMTAYCDLIKASQHFVYIENQFFISSCEVEGTIIENKVGDALVERILRAAQNHEDWRAIIIIPLMPGFQNTVDSPDGSSVRLIMQCQFRSICRGESSIFERLRAQGVDPEDYIQFYALRTWGKIGPNGILVTEQLYIHAKAMIVDDRVAIIGSANINERSMLGSRDSEIAAIVRDTDMVPSVMAGRPYMVAKFAHCFRMRLMREHLGIDVDQICEEELEDEEVERELRRSEEDDQLSLSSPESPTSDQETERVLIDNKMKLQEELIARQERLHSFNHDIDWEQANNPNIQSSKKKTSDPRVTNNKDHQADVRGDGADKMNEHDRLAHDQHARDTVIDAQGREVLVSSISPEGKGTLEIPNKEKKHYHGRRSLSRSPDRQPESILPPHLRGINSDNPASPQLSDFPTLPNTDDTDIGLQPLLRTTSHSSLHPMLAEMKRPVVTEDCMRDPLNDTFYIDIWHTVAENNTKLFRHVFRCMPDSEVKTWKEYKEYMAFGERFSQMQGAGKSKVRVQQEKKGVSGPPGDRIAGIVGDAEKIGKAAERVGKEVEHEMKETVGKSSSGPCNGQDQHPLGKVEKWTEDKQKCGQMGNDATGSKESFNEKEALRTEESTRVISPIPDLDGVKDKESVRPRNITISEPPKPTKISDGTNDQPHPRDNIMNGNSTFSRSGSKRRRRAITKSSLRVFHADDDDVMLCKKDAEKALNLVQGSLVLWPYEWLEREEHGGRWLYPVDQIAPLEIYT
jgi:phospholipase D1/2